MTKRKSDKRKRNHKRVHVRLNADEATQIERNAEATGLTSAALMRELAKGNMPKSTIDAGHIRELIHLRGDLGRAGGLLKLWLSDDLKIKNYKPLDILKVVNNLNSTQHSVSIVIETLSEPGKRGNKHE